MGGFSIGGLIVGLVVGLIAFGSEACKLYKFLRKKHDYLLAQARRVGLIVDVGCEDQYALP